MDHAVGREAGAGALYGDMTRKPAVEIFGDDLADAVIDTGSERVPDLHLFSRYAQAHMEFHLPVRCGRIDFIPVAGVHKVRGGRCLDFQLDDPLMTTLPRNLGFCMGFSARFMRAGF
jgi:hypothetical protein